MTVAPELPPVFVTRRLRAVAVDHPPVALVEPRPRRQLVLVPDFQAAEPGTGREHRPAGPVPLRPVGVRVIRPAGGGLRLTRRGRLLASSA
ncbi:MAG TPA: hypothetical protein VLM05_19910, partial [Mycobacteriales bacterium]|nr:hypothetical protein [Mycobacteriales bacterium]